ncbi:MAG: L,D-transpeptidase family protein [Sphingomonas sp.]|nr:L,D-transpeptidase family protein [Sphingomonas sp.]
MTHLFKRALCAALPLCLVATAAQAEERSAIATGMAIPVGQVASPSMPVPQRGRFVLVDAASARLFMVENGNVVDSMKVIVGKPTAATPMLRSTIYYATFNPYWNVPTDLAKSIIAPRVLKDGAAYLESHGYQVVSGFSRTAQVLPSDSVDWQAVADGTQTVHVRQLPGPANSMGRMKFGFQNDDGIFLHDTPKKELFEASDRGLSNGCVRLEDAPRFARWLLGRDPGEIDAAPEEQVALPRGVPIVITYLNGASSPQLAALR